MFFVLSKILKVFVMPLSWVVGLLIVAYFVKSKKWRRGLFIAAIAMLVIFTNKPLLQWAQYASTKQYAEVGNPEKHYKVAVVMGGFARMEKTSGQMCSYRDRSARIWEPIRLMNAGYVDKILVSGDPTSSMDKEGHTTADYFLQYMRELGIADSCWILEQKARNTRENAVFSIAMLDSLGYTAEDCLLVTSASHIRRSEGCFAAEGWDVDCYAVNIYPKPKVTYTNMLPSWQCATDWDELMNEWVGNVVYQITGYKD